MTTPPMWHINHGDNKDLYCGKTLEQVRGHSFWINFLIDGNNGINLTALFHNSYKAGLICPICSDLFIRNWMDNAPP